jgi:uncharacterized protein (DUF433 family)
MTQADTLQRTYVTRTPGVLGGKPCVAGHRISVAQIAMYVEEQALSADEIVHMHPSLSLAEVHGAVAFYYDNKDEIDASIRDADAYVEAMRRKAGPGLLDRLMTRESHDAAVSS